MANFITFSENLPAYGETEGRTRNGYRGYMTVREIADYTVRDAVSVDFKGKKPIVSGAQRE